jgi:hypothetical protein
MVCGNPKCGKEFQEKRRRGYAQIYCSRRCRWEAQNVRSPQQRIGPAFKSTFYNSASESPIDKLLSGYTQVAPRRRKRTGSNPGAKSPKPKPRVMLWEKDGFFSRTWERGARPVMKAVRERDGTALALTYFQLLRKARKR